MSGGSLLVLATLLAVLSEWLAERFFGGIKRLQGKWMVVISAAVGVALCFGFNVDVLELVGFSGAYMPWLGKLLSGLIVGSGSNALHKFIAPSNPT